MTSPLHLLQRRREAGKSLWFLSTEILGFTFLDEKLHKPWCDWISQPYDQPYRLFLAPRGHGKSTLFTVADCIRLILIDPNVSILLGHYKKHMAEKFLRAIRSHFESNQKLREIAPDLCWDDPENESPVWKQDQIQVKRDKIYQVPTIVATGKEASTVAMHFGRIKLDDIVIDENADSNELLEQTFEWVQSMEGMLDGFGDQKVDITGTRWRHNDTYGRMLEEFPGQIRTYTRSVLENGEPIWKSSPRYGTVQQITDLEKRVGSFLFHANYMNSPVPRGAVVFNMEDVDVRYFEAEGEGLTKVPLLPRFHPDGRPANYYYYTAIDPNTTEDTAHDPGVVMTVAIDDREHMWVVRLDHGHPNQTTLIDWVRHHFVTFQPRAIMVEAIAYQTTLAYWLKQDAVACGHYYPIFEIKKRISSKFARIVTLQGVTESHRLHIPSWQMFKPLVDEMRIYTEAAKRDDCLDSLADVAAYGQKPPEIELPIKTRPKSPITIDRILGRMRRQDDAIVERGKPGLLPQKGFPPARGLGRLRLRA